MNEQHDYERPAPAVVKLKSSSSQGGKEGYELTVASTATEADVDHAVAMAYRARQGALSVLDGSYEERFAVGPERGSGRTRRLPAVDERRCPASCMRTDALGRDVGWIPCVLVELHPGPHEGESGRTFAESGESYYFG